MIVKWILLALVRTMLVFCATLLLSFSACASTHKVSITATVNDSGNVVFELTSADQGEVPINDLTVVGVVDGAWNYKNPLWHLSANVGTYVNAQKIVYGAEIAGLHSTTPTPLKVGARYMVEIMGAGITEAYEFEVERRDGAWHVLVLGHALGRPR